MNDDARKIENYEVKNGIHISGKEILYAEDLFASEPYLVCNCQWGNPLGIDTYDNAVAYSDYIEAMTEFLDRASAEIERVRNQRAERGISNEPLTASDCIPGSKNAHYENQLVVIKPERLVASARTADEQLHLATGGFGCNPDARGQAVFCKNIFSGKPVCWERFDVVGIVQSERIPEWAHRRLEEMGISIAKTKPPKVYMASLADARQNGELEAYRESQRLNQACAISIKDAINDSHKGNYSYDLPSALKMITEEYGTERVQVVLANTVEYKDFDGRFSRENREWAKGIPIPQMAKEQRAAFVCEAHPAILDGFINTARKEWQEKKPSVLEHLGTTVKPPQSKKNASSREEQGR